MTHRRSPRTRLGRSLAKKLQRERRVISDSRDRIRALLWEYEELEDCSDQAIRALDDAVTHLSEHV